MKVNQATHSVGMMCRLLGVSRSGFYAARERPMSNRARRDLALTGKIEAIHRGSNGVYGSPNIHAELADDHGIRVGRKRVARLMRRAGLRGVTLRRYVVTTQSDPRDKRAIDLVDRQFYADGPDRLWVADITYIAGFPRWGPPDFPRWGPPNGVTGGAEGDDSYSSFFLLASFRALTPR